ncbi:jupiter microtubule associated homolog 1 isoform X2 [Manduca sexta]|nr:jupiter microtubule associated homolog 1 isoform X2 [Manduca sexta]
MNLPCFHLACTYSVKKKASEQRNANRDKMTSTSFNVGLNDTARLSSRVLRPPGGGHTDIFGSEPEPPRTGRRQVPQAGQGDEVKATNGTDAPAANGQASTPEAPAPVEAKVESPTKVESPAKIESPPKIDSPTKPEQAKMEPPKRVRVPPGGFSSGLW